MLCVIVMFCYVILRYIALPSITLYLLASGPVALLVSAYSVEFSILHFGVCRCIYQ